MRAGVLVVCVVACYRPVATPNGGDAPPMGKDGPSGLDALDAGPMPDPACLGPFGMGSATPINPVSAFALADEFVDGIGSAPYGALIQDGVLNDVAPPTVGSYSTINPFSTTTAFAVALSRDGKYLYYADRTPSIEVAMNTGAADTFDAPGSAGLPEGITAPGTPTDGGTGPLRMIAQAGSAAFQEILESVNGWQVVGGALQADSGGEISGPSLSDDGLVLAYSYVGNGAPSGIYIAERPSVNDVFDLRQTKSNLLVMGTYATPELGSDCSTLWGVDVLQGRIVQYVNLSL